MSTEGCDYDISGLPGDVCPECGLALSKHCKEKRRPWWSRWTWPPYVLAAWPLMLTAGLVGMYVVGRVQLGRWPFTGGLDDPKGIPVVAQLMYVHGFLTLLTPFVAAALGLCFLSMCYIKWISPRTAVQILVTAVVSTLVAVIVEHYVHVWEWWLD